jgi:hypothetical protein
MPSSRASWRIRKRRRAKAPLDKEEPRTHLTRTWVNRRYDARSVDDPGYTDTVREDFDRIADLSEAEGWDRRVVMGPRRPGCR